VCPLISDCSLRSGLPVGGRLSPGAPRVTGELSVGGLKQPTPPNTALRLVRLLRPLGELTTPPTSARHSPPPLSPRRSPPSVTLPSSLLVVRAGACEAVTSFICSGWWATVVAVTSPLHSPDRLRSLLPSSQVATALSSSSSMRAHLVQTVSTDQSCAATTSGSRRAGPTAFFVFRQPLTGA
jgi:hypothetical protein